MRWFRKRHTHDVAEEFDPHEVLLDAHNLPSFNRYQMEGRIEAPLPKRASFLIGVFFTLVLCTLFSRLAYLQVVQGAQFAEQSSRNHLAHATIFAERGVIYDRTGTMLAWNEPVANEPFAARGYAETRGLAHTIGYVRLPRRDTSGFFHRFYIEGVSGVEESYDELLRGTNGTTIKESNAHGETVSEHAIRPPVDGTSLTLTIDATLQDALYGLIEDRVRESRFESGSSVIMDVHTGDILAMVSYPEFDLRVMTSATSSQAIAALQADPRNVFINRAVSGLYTPGSIVKPIVAIAALQEGVVEPGASILSTGALVLPNPYVPSAPTIFRDWRAHGWVDMRRALAVSSNVYFFHIGGGYRDQAGLGITRLEQYSRMFGLAERTGIKLAGEAAGVIPNPAWKKEVFGEDVWRVGDTYNTSIGQYGYQITPLQAVRATAAIASRGALVTPRLSLEEPVERTQLPITEKHYDVVHDGMRLAVTEGTAQALSFPWVAVAGKTGTAEVGSRKEFVNSWVIGFFPYDKPRYAFVTLMERAPAGTLQGSPYVMHQFFRWLHEHEPDYLE